MSRVGNKPIPIPANVNLSIDVDHVKVSGPKGEMVQTIPNPITVRREENRLFVERPSNERQHRALHGLTRALLNNHVNGVAIGFHKRLEIIGVGYRAEVKGQTLTLYLGYSHPIVYQVPETVTAKMDGNAIVLECCNKYLLGETAAKIRSFRPPEPYKGKGIRYADEMIRRKVGKKNV